MIIEISGSAVSGGCAVIALVGGGLIRWVSGQIDGVKKTQSVQFAKLDANAKELSDYKLHAAETYVNRESLREALKPMMDSIEELKDEIRELRKS